MKSFGYKPIKLKQLEESRKNMEKSRKVKQQERIMAGLPIMQMDEVTYNSPCLSKESESFLEMRQKKPKENRQKMYHSRMSMCAMESFGKHKITREYDKRLPMKDIEVVADLINQVERLDNGDQRLRRSFRDMVNGVEQHGSPRDHHANHYRFPQHQQRGNQKPSPAPSPASPSSKSLVHPSGFSPVEKPPRLKNKVEMQTSKSAEASGTTLSRSRSEARTEAYGATKKPLHVKKRTRNQGLADPIKHPAALQQADVAASLPNLMHNYLQRGGNGEGLSPLPNLSPHTRRQLRASQLHKADKLVALTHVQKPLQRQEVMMVVNFMDKDHDGDISLEEFSKALREAKQHIMGDAKLEDIFHRIDDVLRLEKLRVSDLFSKFDLDGGGSLSREEMMEGLSILCDVSRVKILELQKYKRLNAQKKRKEDEEKRKKAVNFLTDCNALPDQVMGDPFYIYKGQKGANFDRIIAKVSETEFQGLNNELQELMAHDSPDEDSNDFDVNSNVSKWKQEAIDRKKRWLDKFGSCNDEETKLLKQTFFEEELLPNLHKERGRRTAFGYYVKDEGDIVRRAWMRIAREKPLG